ncbi:hypothetical protein [Paraburkholderia rhizosphaerae]|uniref:Uncharacterized protein n=1 Tax=Paraburkholderia rhizosphaerae TaxID=480658 RepID=A0A4R8M289_9BURK|nr:hypothetical protein [Paraburkholderia rhizosphaerae]TDY53579.1 hypothetical protein BX592_103392 [Paraburkholderia rhizosphaerae]
MQVQSTSTSYSFNQPGLMSSGAGFASGNHAAAYDSGRRQGAYEAINAMSGNDSFMSSGGDRFSRADRTEAAYHSGRQQGAYDAVNAMSGAHANAGPQIISPEEASQSGGTPDAADQGQGCAGGCGGDGQAGGGGAQASGSGQKTDPGQIMQMVMGIIAPMISQALGAMGGGGAASGLLGGLGGSASS